MSVETILYIMIGGISAVAVVLSILLTTKICCADENEPGK